VGANRERLDGLDVLVQDPCHRHAEEVYWQATAKAS
jgi:hypothetical protein